MPLYRTATDFEIDVQGRNTSDVAAEIRELFIKEDMLS